MPTDQVLSTMSERELGEVLGVKPFGALRRLSKRISERFQVREFGGA